MSIEKILSALNGVRQTGPDRYIAKCPAHADKSPSLAIRDCADGRTLIYCHAGCPTEAVMDALGMRMDALMPPNVHGHYRPMRHPFDARQILECVSHELMVASVILSDVLDGVPLTEELRKRLFLASGRLSAAVTANDTLTVPPELKRLRAGAFA